MHIICQIIHAFTVNLKTAKKPSWTIILKGCLSIKNNNLSNLSKEGLNVQNRRHKCGHPLLIPLMGGHLLQNGEMS